MRQRLYVAGVLAGLGALIVVAIVVLRFGRYDPSPPLLKDHPNAAIAGEIVYLDKNDCIIRAAASGAWREQVYCLSLERYTLRPMVAWIDKDTVAYFTWDTPQIALTEIDLKTKAIRHSVVPSPALGNYGTLGVEAPNGDLVKQDNEQGIWVVSNGLRTRIARFEVPDYRTPEAETWSPDSKWILVRYYPEENLSVSELWLISRDGKTRGTLATDAGDSETSWWIDGLGAWPNLLGAKK